MSLAVVFSRAQVGMHAPLVTIEVHLSSGLPAFNIVGLPEKVVKESRDRVRSALLFNDFDIPARRITVNLAPADLPKEGGRFDLPIAIAILAANGVVPSDDLQKYELGGELSLTGALRPIRAALPFSLACQKTSRSLILPNENVTEASMVPNTVLYSAKHMVEVVAHFCNEKKLRVCETNKHDTVDCVYPDMNDVIGQQDAKLALSVAACGGHSVLMQGPPGTGKSMLASRFPGIMPKLSINQGLETAAVYSSSARGFDSAKWLQRPFRTPHHSASSVALVGGGSPPKPGEISLAHHGVLFLDELPEFSRSVLESLREPLESGSICISRAAQQATFPAKFQLIAAMNPCPCGYLGDKLRECYCSPSDIERYGRRLSGPLLDRIDIVLEVGRVSAYEVLSGEPLLNETSQQIQKKVQQSRDRQYQRQGKLNASLTSAETKAICTLGGSEKKMVLRMMETLKLSARSYHRILKVAQSVCDLEGKDKLDAVALSQAVSWRI